MRKAFVITIALAGIVLILARLLTDAALAADDNWEFIEALGASVLFPVPILQPSSDSILPTHRFP